MDDSLTHWGIQGQKWGVRRYQYLDGSLTEEGKLRYGKNYKSPSNKVVNTKRARNMSTEDLQENIKRLQLEKQYVDLSKENYNDGKSKVNNILADAGNTVLKAAAVGVGLYAAKQIVAAVINKDAADLIKTK